LKTQNTDDDDDDDNNNNNNNIVIIYSGIKYLLNIYRSE